jgi:hypothetical protein
MTLNIDVHEPADIISAITPVKDITTNISNFNDNQWADYHWNTVDNAVVNVERKTWGEILSNIDAVEEQLQRHLRNHPTATLIFLVEGILTSVNGGGVSTLRPARSGQIYVRGRVFKYRTMGGLYAWLYQVSKYCVVIPTATKSDSAAFLSTAYLADQKSGHSTLNRPIKKTYYNPDPQVIQLMGIVGEAKIGETRAEALIVEYGSVWNILSAGFNGKPNIPDWKDLTKVPGIGTTIAQRILRSVGRTDI